MTMLLQPGSQESETVPLTILCVDDEENVLRTLYRLFRQEEFHVVTAASGAEGLELLKSSENIGLILSDQRMPGMTGTAFLQAAALISPDSSRMILTGYSDVSAAIDAINQGGAYRFLTKPWIEHELLQAVREGLHRYQLTRENQRLTALVTKQNGELSEWNDNMKKRLLQQTVQLRKQLQGAHLQESRSKKICDAVVLSFSDMLGLRNPRYNKHLRTVAALADQIALKLGVEPHLREEIRMAALLHDTGKIGLPDRLLSKGLMTPDDVREYQSHAVRGQTAIDKIDELREVGVFIRHHHEAYNGSGFPDGLSGEQIPLGARIIALADWLENAFSHENAPNAKYELTRKLANQGGHLFDPALLPAANFAVSQVLHDPPQLRDFSEEELPLEKVTVGMILSQDIFSGTGVLLLERGCRLESSELEALRHYYSNDHATTGVMVLKKSIGASRPE